MSEYETLFAEHQTLQEQLAASPDSVGLDKVQDFVQRTRLAGARIGDAEQREQLRAILRHWSVFVYGQTGEYPASQLVPCTTSCYVANCPGYHLGFEISDAVCSGTILVGVVGWALLLPQV